MEWFTIPQLGMGFHETSEAEATWAPASTCFFQRSVPNLKFEHWGSFFLNKDHQNL